jgi:hypothetical protein
MHSAAPRRTASAATDTLFGGGCGAGKLWFGATSWLAPVSFLRAEAGIRLVALRAAARISYLDIPPRGADFRQYEAQRCKSTKPRKTSRGVHRSISTAL